MREVRAPLVRMVPFLLVTLLLAGCGGDVSPPQTPVAEHLQKLAQYYGRYTSSHQGKGPANAAELKKYLASEGVKDVDEMLTSPRDKQPYVLIFNVGGGAPMPGSSGAVIAHEQTGVDGKRFVAMMLGGVEEVNEERFKQLLSQK